MPEHLERREVVHDLTEAEKLCPCCGQPRVCIGEQTAEQLDLEPATLLRAADRQEDLRLPALRPGGGARRSNACRPPGRPQVGPIAKGLCGPGLLAHVITAKFADHTPLHRLAGQLARSGVDVARSTLGDWLAAAADLLAPLYLLMHQRLLLSRVIHGDDTGGEAARGGADRTRKAHLWVCIGDADYPYVVFDFTADYTAAGPERFLERLQGLPPGRRPGPVRRAVRRRTRSSTSAAGRTPAASSWRRRRARTSGPSAALELIGQLYAIERELPPLLPPSDDPVATGAAPAAGRATAADCGSSKPSRSWPS